MKWNFQEVGIDIEEYILFLLACIYVCVCVFGCTGALLVFLFRAAGGTEGSQRYTQKTAALAVVAAASHFGNSQVDKNELC